jgi:hypothetical protein
VKREQKNFMSRLNIGFFLHFASILFVPFKLMNAENHCIIIANTNASPSETEKIIMVNAPKKLYMEAKG